MKAAEPNMASKASSKRGASSSLKKLSSKNHLLIKRRASAVRKHVIKVELLIFGDSELEFGRGV